MIKPYWPALDGVRAVAVSAVVAYHLGYLPGGWLGVDIFFVLSGFLITSLLLSEAAGPQRIGLGAFWSRRARRLLPAVLGLLAAVALYCLAGGPEVVAAQLRGPALATLLYSANWQQIAVGHSYFAQFAAPDPLLHTWSLAIEEQYYLVWPLVVAGALGLARRRNWSAPRLVGWTAVTAGLTSAAWMGVAAHVYGFNRAYLGTDTRAWELLFGAAAAVWLRPGLAAGGRRRPRPAPARPAGRLWRFGPVAGAGIVAAGISVAGGPPGWIWDGGLVVISLAVLLVVVGVARVPDGPLARLLGASPLRWLGRISYSVYIWHWPVIVLMTGTDTGLAGARLLAARVGAILGLSCLSYYGLERPLRRADFSGFRRRFLVPVALASTTVALVAATVTPAAAGTAAVGPATRVAPAGLDLSLPPGRVPSAADPLRVWILGDSVMNDSSPGLTAALQATGEVQVVANNSFGGWGLTTDKLWPGDGRQIIRQARPELIIGTWSWDNPMAQADPTGYAALLKSTLAGLLSPGDGVSDVLLLQFPTTGPYPLYPTPEAERAAWISTLSGERAWDVAAQEAVAGFPGQAAYLPTSELFAPAGRFLVWMKTPAGAWLRARKVDDIHMCPYGAAELGQLVESALAPMFDLGPMAAGWQDGAWIHDPRYNDPAGACPADQPTLPYRGTPLP
ncbi:MAG: acyltransferase family protein [Acidimicrobiales bacterium]